MTILPLASCVFDKISKCHDDFITEAIAEVISISNHKFTLSERLYTVTVSFENLINKLREININWITTPAQLLDLLRNELKINCSWFTNKWQRVFFVFYLRYEDATE